MSTLEGRTADALLVVDVQHDVVGGAYRRDDVVGAIAGLVERSRAAGVPVVWVQHSDEGLRAGSAGWEFVPELVPAEGEALVAKAFGDSFEGTDLERVLAERGAGHLIVCGAETDACIRSTIHGAFTRGYDVTLVGDAHTSGDKTEWGAPAVADVVAHTNLYWRFQSAPGRNAAVVDACDITFDRPA